MRIPKYDGVNTVRDSQRRWRGVILTGDGAGRKVMVQRSRDRGKPDNWKAILTEIMRTPTATLTSQSIDSLPHFLPRVDSHRVTRELPPDNESPNCLDHVLRRLRPLQENAP